MTAITFKTNIKRYTPRMIKGFLTGILTLAFLSFPLASLTPPSHAGMSSHDEGTASRSCLAGCAGNSMGVTADINRQRPEEKQNKDPEPQAGPYFAQFLEFYEPRKITPVNKYGAPVLRPPDLVLAYQNYRS